MFYKVHILDSANYIRLSNYFIVSNNQFYYLLFNLDFLFHSILEAITMNIP